MKRLFIILMAAVPTLASADSYNYLNIVGSTAQSVARTAVKRITFEGGNIVVATTSGTTLTAPLSTLTQLTFSDTALGVGSVGDQQPLALQGESLVVAGHGTLQVYNAGGQLMRQLRVDSTRGELNVSDLPRGIYLARFGRQTLKFIH